MATQPKISRRITTTAPDGTSRDWIAPARIKAERIPRWREQMTRTLESHGWIVVK